MLDSFRTNDGDDVLTDIQEDLSLRCAIRTIDALQQCSELYEQRGRHSNTYTDEKQSTAVVSFAMMMQLAHDV